MSQSELTTDDLESKSEIGTCSDCSEEGCSINLRGMSDKIVFRPDEEIDDRSMADCVIFYSSESDDRSLGPNEVPIGDDRSESSPLESLAIVELKNNINNPKNIEDQINGALEFAKELLQECDVPWRLNSFCLVVHKSSSSNASKKIRRKQIMKNIGGDVHIFRPIPVSSGEILTEVEHWDDVNETAKQISD